MRFNKTRPITKPKEMLDEEDKTSIYTSDDIETQVYNLSQKYKFTIFENENYSKLKNLINNTMISTTEEVNMSYKRQHRVPQLKLEKLRYIDKGITELKDTFEKERVLLKKFIKIHLYRIINPIETFIVRHLQKVKMLNETERLDKIRMKEEKIRMLGLRIQAKTIKLKKKLVKEIDSFFTPFDYADIEKQMAEDDYNNYIQRMSVDDHNWYIIDELTKTDMCTSQEDIDYLNSQLILSY